MKGNYKTVKKSTKKNLKPNMLKLNNLKKLSNFIKECPIPV